MFRGGRWAYTFSLWNYASVYCCWGCLVQFYYQTQSASFPPLTSPQMWLYSSQFLGNGGGCTDTYSSSQLPVSSKMPTTDQKQLGISVWKCSAQASTSSLACLKVIALWFRHMYSLTLTSGYWSRAVFSYTILTISSTMLAYRPSSFLAFSEGAPGRHRDRSGLSQALTLPSRSMQMRSSVGLKYPRLRYNFSKPSRALSRRYKFSGKGMSSMSDSLTGIRSTYTLAVQEVLQKSRPNSQLRYLVLTMQSSLSRHWKNSRYLWNSGRVWKLSKYSQSYSLVRLLTRTLQRPCQGRDWRRCRPSRQLYFFRVGGLYSRESALPICYRTIMSCSQNTFLTQKGTKSQIFDMYLLIFYGFCTLYS